MIIAVPLHILAVVIWVGGMFFAYMVLRPAAAGQLQPPERLALWVAVFGRFFPWVWVAILTILGTGLWMIWGVYGGFSALPPYIHIMFATGVVMMLIFLHVFFAPYPRLRRAVAAEDWPAGAKQLAMIRVLVGINTLIGVATLLIAAAGRFIS